jgi:DNA repair exonuclease SbcCD ATPase subunit
MKDFRNNGIWSSGIGKPLKNVLQYDGRTNRVLTTRLDKNPECYVCGSNYEASLASAHYRRETINTKSSLSLKKLREKIQTLTKKPLRNLITNFEFIPNYEEAYSDLQAIHTKLRFLIRGVKRDGSNGESEIDKYFDDLQQILEPKQTSNPATMIKSLRQNRTHLNTLKRLARKICKKLEMTNSPKEPVRKEIKNIYDGLVQIEKTVSGTLSLSEAGFQPMQEVYAVNPKDSKTVNDILILLSLKN